MIPLTAKEAYAVRRVRLIKEAHRLRAQGHTLASIGLRLGGFKRSTVCDWINKRQRT